MNDILEACPECGNDDKKMVSNTPVWFECKACGYYEDQFKGPSLSRQSNPMGGLIQYL